MSKRRKKKIVRVIHQTVGPLPLRLAERFAGDLLVFSDASQKRQGGLAAVLFGDAASAPLISTRSVPLLGSNELELQAALFALSQAQQHFPGRQLALFSDNQDAVARLSRACAQGLAQDPELMRMLAAFDLGTSLAHVAVCWVKGHSSCRGNTLADLHAAEAAR